MKRFMGFALFLLLLMVTAMFLSTMNIIDLSSVFGFTRTATSILQVLRSENLLFLATDRITTYVYSEIDDNSLLLGNREGLLIMKVSYLYGMDLQQLTLDSLENDIGTVTVHLPELEMLEISPDLSTAEVYTKTSGLVWLYDLLAGNDMQEELLHQLDLVAVNFARSADLLPEREEVVARLNGFAPVLSEYAGTQIVFQ